MSRSDKILKLIKKNPALSSQEIWKKLEENVSHRTVQRDLTELHSQGLIETHAIGRDIVYSLPSNTPSASSYFLDRFWTEFFNINMAFQKGYNSFDTFLKLRSLVTLLPKELREELEPEFDKSKYEWKYDYLVRKSFDVSQVNELDDRAWILETSELINFLMSKVSALVHEKYSKLPMIQGKNA